MDVMAEPYLSFPADGVGTLAFANRAEVEAFIQDELAFWRSLTGDGSQNSETVWARVQAHYNALQQHLDTSSMAALATKMFVSIGLPVSTSPLIDYLGMVRKTDPDLAMTCIALCIGAIEFTLRPAINQKALAHLIAWRAGLGAQTLPPVRDQLDELITSTRRQAAGSRSQAKQLMDRLEKAEARGARALRIGSRYLQNKLARQRSSDSNLTRASIDDMAATKALYMEHMALSAPVEYWRNKAGGHAGRAKRYREILLGYTALAGFALVCILLMLAEHTIAVATKDSPAAVFFVLATLGVVITTIVFWIARVLTRLYLSEVHLSMDAEERATMVNTYLALVSTGEASKEDRAIVLASLFRPTADGIVKDDAAPDMSPSGIISKIAAGR